MPSNYTKNYQLSQWEADDRIQRTDFNADNAKIDGALGALAAGKGNCRVAWGSYTGSGTFGASHPNTLTFPFKPLVVVMSIGKDPSVLVAGATEIYQNIGHVRCYWTLSWTGNSVSWYVTHSEYLNGGTVTLGAENQWNAKEQVCHYVAFGAADN